MFYTFNISLLGHTDRSPWPSWGDGGQTVKTAINPHSHWNPPTSKVINPGDSITYGMRLSACPGGPRTRDAALTAVGEPILKAVPGYTISTEMATAKLIVVSAPPLAHVVTAVSSNASVLSVDATASSVVHGQVVFPIRGRARGRARVSVVFSDGTNATVHYFVLPPFVEQIQRVTQHWAETAWLPRDYPDPFGRGASVMPWDREDGRHRFNDGRAYDVGLSGACRVQQGMPCRPPALCKLRLKPETLWACMLVCDHCLGPITCAGACMCTTPSYAMSMCFMEAKHGTSHAWCHISWPCSLASPFDFTLVLWLDDAGAANNLGFATTQAFMPQQYAVKKIDEYIEFTLYGTKNDTAKAPFKSLQLPEPNNGVRMTLFYYNQTYFPWNYTEAVECGSVAGLNYNW